MKAKPNVTELLAKAQKPGEDSLRLHPVYRGKLEVTPKCRIRDSSDFAIWYSPGVAAPCRDIAAHPEQVFAHTNKANFVEKEIKEVVLRALNNVAPEVDLASIDPGRELRDQIDIDSVDFLNFVLGLHKELGVDIPDADVPKITTLNKCVDYLVARVKQR